MNNVILVGNITRDLDLRKTQTNKSVVDFSLAINDGYGDNKTTEFVRCQAWEKGAENLCKLCGKGTKLLVEGRIHTSSYENKEGKKIENTNVIVGNFEILSWNKPKPTGNEKVNFVSDDLPFDDANNSSDSELDFY